MGTCVVKGKWWKTFALNEGSLLICRVGSQGL